MQNTDLSHGARFWNSQYTRQTACQAYFSVPGIPEELNRRISGDAEIGYVDWLRHNLEPGKRALLLGCGTTGDEINVVKSGLAQSVVAVDFSRTAIATAKQNAANAGCADQIEYICGDASLPNFGHDFDHVLAFGFVHHVENLEAFFAACAASLTAGGAFCFLEYVGPNRNQWTAEQLRICDDLLAKAPASLVRRNYYPLWYRVLRRAYELSVGALVQPALQRLGGSPKRLADRLETHPILQRHVPRVPAAFVAAGDPTESVRSEEILNILPNKFDIETRVDVGFSLVIPTLNGIAGNFRPTTSSSERWLSHLLAEDERVVRDGTLPSNLTAVIARRRRQET